MSDSTCYPEFECVFNDIIYLFGYTDLKTGKTVNVFHVSDNNQMDETHSCGSTIPDLSDYFHNTDEAIVVFLDKE